MLIGWHHWFAYPWALVLLALLPALGVLAAVALRRRRRALAQLGQLPAVAALLSTRPQRRALRAACALAGLALLILGTAGPQWGRDRERATEPGRDVVVVLDLSRSMLAQDALGQSSPNRLGLARDALADLANEVQQRGGHRLALVACAARARVVCPLTHDYDCFRDALAQLDPDDPRLGPAPGSPVPPSDTRLGAGLRLAVQIQDPRYQGFQDILLLSDGDDPAGDEEWREGVEAARAQGIPISTVGVGNPDQGTHIPIRNGYLRYQGQEVLTRLHEQPLQTMARQTGGMYIPAHTRALPLGTLFRASLDTKPGREETEVVLPQLRQHAPWFLALALALLALEMILSEPRRVARTQDTSLSRASHEVPVLTVTSPDRRIARPPVPEAGA